MPKYIFVSRSRIEATSLCRSLIGQHVLTTNILCAYMRIHFHPKCGVWDELSSPYMYSSHSIDANTRVLLASMTQVAMYECVIRSVACVPYLQRDEIPDFGKPCPESKATSR
jgi:hypothetical protein